MKIKNVLSLFDGLSCGQIALNRCGISYDNYYASEVDKYAMKVTQANYPNTIQLGDVTNLKKQHIEKPDLIMGGFPCQAFSNAGKQLGLEDVRGQLLFYMLDVIKYYKPKYFLMENVKGILNKKFKPVIDLIYKELESVGYDVQHTLINSALVSAQNRERVYFTNFDVSQPENKEILLKDILENGYTNRTKSYCIDANYAKGSNLKRYFSRGSRQIVFLNKEKFEYCKNLNEQGLSLGNVKKEYIRLLNLIEVKKAQTIPDEYSFAEVCNSSAKGIIGNGWTVDVICHIFKEMLKKEEEIHG